MDNQLNKNNYDNQYNFKLTIIVYIKYHLPEEQLLIQKDIFMPMFITELFAMAKIWKQLKFPTDKWIKKPSYLYTMEYYIDISKEEIL